MSVKVASDKSTKKVQSILNFTDNNIKKTITCTICEMTYNSKLPVDVDLHKKYHLEFTNGISWPNTLTPSNYLAQNFNLVVTETRPKLGKLKSIKAQNIVKARIIVIDKTNKRQIEKVDKILKMVNQELNATEDSKQWRNLNFKNSKAFVIVINNKAVGLCTTDTITEGKWMIFKNQKLVPNQTISGVKIGISRIWISPRWRQLGLGLKLLKFVTENSIYGQSLFKNQIAFSQPSSNGGKLAKSFNGVLHKSGEVLIQVYTEDV
ncbi:ECO1 [Candida jiufengensis]|uniref:ECO1 n=1 Tax=Candida jiufengensis TaxID=497108 RepID=UPI00222433E6|nr:ECO1 [Candida jiufengensis]KAI5951371.1 ECO1 [Candida jiufengensis]